MSSVKLTSPEETHGLKVDTSFSTNLDKTLWKLNLNCGKLHCITLQGLTLAAQWRRAQLWRSQLPGCSQLERDSRNNINCRRCWVWTTTGKFLMMRWCRLDHQQLLSELLFCFSSFGIKKDKREKKLKTKKTQTNEDASLILMATHHWWPWLKKIHDRMKLEKERSTCGRLHQHKDVCDKTDEVAGDNSSWTGSSTRWCWS